VPQDFDRLAKAILAAAELPFDLLQNAIATTASFETSFYAGHFKTSAVREHDLDAFFEGAVDHVVLAKTAAALLALLLHPVVEARLAAANLASTGHFEPLGSASVRFHFGHRRLPIASFGRSLVKKSRFRLRMRDAAYGATPRSCQVPGKEALA
jgi:hypothetical protein